MAVVPKDLPLPELWQQLPGDDASKHEALAAIVAERARGVGLRGGAVAEIKELLDAGELGRIQALLDAGNTENAGAPHSVGRFGLRGGGFSSLFAFGSGDAVPSEPTRAETLLSQGDVDEALAELHTNPGDRVELSIASAVRHLERGELRAAYSALERLQRARETKHLAASLAPLTRAFEPSTLLGRLKHYFKTPDPESVTLRGDDVANLDGRFALLRAALSRLAGADGAVHIARREPEDDYHTFVKRGAQLISEKAAEIAERIRTVEEEQTKTPGKVDTKLASLYSRGAAEMAELRERLLATSPLRPEGALRLARTAEPSTPENPIVHGDRVVADLAEAMRFAGVGGMQSVRWLSNTGNRAWANHGFNDLNIGRYGGGCKNTIFHEFGHHLEFNHPQIQAACRRFLDDRCEGEPRPLNDLIKGAHYRADEIARPDHFVSPYVAKVYDDNMTEVVSMGLEHMSTDRTMMKLLVKDPEHFHLTLGILLASR